MSSCGEALPPKGTGDGGAHKKQSYLSGVQRQKTWRSKACFSLRRTTLAPRRIRGGSRNIWKRGGKTRSFMNFRTDRFALNADKSSRLCTNSKVSIDDIEASTAKRRPAFEIAEMVPIDLPRTKNDKKRLQKWHFHKDPLIVSLPADDANAHDVRLVAERLEISKQRNRVLVRILFIISLLETWSPLNPSWARFSGSKFRFGFGMNLKLRALVWTWFSWEFLSISRLDLPPNLRRWRRRPRHWIAFSP